LRTDFAATELRRSLKNRHGADAIAHCIAVRRFGRPER
jgi:hypothetical protein